MVGSLSTRYHRHPTRHTTHDKHYKMSTTNYARLTKEWEAMLGWHTHLAENPKAKMSDWLRDNEYCDSKDKTGDGHARYIRHIQANGKVLAVPEAERIEWIQGKLKEYTTKGEVAQRTGVAGGIRVKPGTAHHAKAEVLEPGATAKPKKAGKVISKKALSALLECFESTVNRLKEQVELDEKVALKTDTIKTRTGLNKAILARVLKEESAWASLKAPPEPTPEPTPEASEAESEASEADEASECESESEESN